MPRSAEPNPAADPPEDDLERRVRARLEDLVRFCRVVAHELGGTMLPSRPRPSDLDDHPQWQRLCFQTQALAAHIRETKAVLDRFRAGSDDGAPATGFSEWSRQQRPLLNALLRSGRLELVCDDPRAEPAACDAPWTRGVAVLLLAIDAQSPADGWDSVRLRFAPPSADGQRVRVETRPDPETPLRLPEIGRHAWGGASPASWEARTACLAVPAD